MPRESRGCQSCRQRRIGCDGGLPSCQQCLRTNRHCSGPLQGPIIIDQSRQVMLRLNKAKSQSKGRATRIIIQPSHRDLFSAAFMSEFITFTSCNSDGPSRLAWLSQMGDIPQGHRGPALDISIQAVATAYCAVESNNPAALQEACRMYGEALSLHSKSISHQPRAPSLGVLCTSVVLSLFEAIWGTNGEAYCAHLSAARDVLATSWSELSHDAEPHLDFLREIYDHVASQSVRVSHSIHLIIALILIIVVRTGYSSDPLRYIRKYGDKGPFNEIIRTARRDSTNYQ